MKKFILSLPLCLLGFALQAQDNSPSRQKEIGLLMSNSLYPHGFAYRWGNESAMWRIQAFNLRASRNETTDDNVSRVNWSHQFDLSFGREYRKKLNDRIESRMGLGLMGSNSTVRNSFQLNGSNEFSYNSSHRYSASLFGILGLNYQLSSQYVIGAEILPAVGYELRQVVEESHDEPRRTQNSDNLFLYMSSSSIQLSLMYRFN